MARLKIKARVFDSLDSRTIEVRGQTARCLLALVEAGARGVTAAEVSSWALRLAAYCWDLQRKHGLLVEMERESHPGGWHGRHILRTRVEILTDDPPPAALAQKEAA